VSCPACSTSPSGKDHWFAEITIANSGGVRDKTNNVYDSTPQSNGYEAVVMPCIEARGSGLYGPWPVQDVDVHDNTTDPSMGEIIGAVRATRSTTTLTRVPAATRFIGRTSGAFPFFRGSGEESRAVRVTGTNSSASLHARCGIVSSSAFLASGYLSTRGAGRSAAQRAGAPFALPRSRDDGCSSRKRCGAGRLRGALTRPLLLVQKIRNDRRALFDAG
jgi:hypothetical protein